VILVTCVPHVAVPPDLSRPSQAGTDRQLVFPLAIEAGLLDALNAHLPKTLEPLASWTRTGKLELPDGDVVRQHWWSFRVTQLKAAALLEGASGRDVPRLETQRAGKPGGWLSLPPQWRTRGAASPGDTISRYSRGTWGSLATSGLRGQAVPSMGWEGRRLWRPRLGMQEVGICG